MKKISITILTAASLLTGCAIQVQQAQVKAAREVPRGAEAKPIQFKKILIKLRRGEEIGTTHVGLACIPQGKAEWKGGRINVTDDEFTDAFRETLERFNYPVVGDPNALFDDPSSWKAELLIAGQVTKLNIGACYPLAGFGNFKDSKGGAYVRVSWQVYGQLERKVVYELTTEGSAQSTDAASFGIERNLTNAFAAAVENLLADEKFHLLVLRTNAGAAPNGTAGSRAAALVNEETTAVETIALRTKSEGSQSLATARNSTVTVFAGGGFGSGFIVSSDGYVLTNEHVVREARFVTVRLANGREIVGDVIRTNTARDVALLKLRESNLPAAQLAINLQPEIGTDVYAIGTPRREALDLTMSKGIVSAYRDEQGKKFIQSDTQIHPGNSGGPLVLKNGQVIGIAAQGLLLGGVSQNLNFFIPIDEALRALKVIIQ